MAEQRLLSSRRMRRILLTVIVGFLCQLFFFAFRSYRRDIQQAENGSLMRLAGIANSLALQIDGEAHQQLMKRHLTKDAITSHQQDSIYQAIHHILARNFEANMLKTPVYTLIFDSLQKKYVFGVTSSEQPYFRHEYNSAPKAYMDKTTEGAMIPMYKDEFGTWLSAFAVIKNAKGQAVAMVQADEKFDLFLQRERTDIFKNILVSVVFFIIVLIVLIQILQSILQKEWRDKIALAHANEQVKQLDNFRKEMITNVSHDLRTPIANVMGFAEVLQQKDEQLSPDEKNKYLDVIIKEAKRLNQLLRGLFDLSLLESEQIKLEEEVLNLSELVQDVLQKYTLKAEEKKVQLITDIEDTPPLINADIRWMDRVIQNLLDNAIKYVNQGGFIKLSLFTEGGQLHFKVCNSGNPIPADLLPQVFDRYFKYSKTRNDNSTGLGLAIVKRVIELHKGHIWAEVNDDITTLRFTLPI